MPTTKTIDHDRTKPHPSSLLSSTPLPPPPHPTKQNRRGWLFHRGGGSTTKKSTTTTTTGISTTTNASAAVEHTTTTPKTNHVVRYAGTTNSQDSTMSSSIVTTTNHHNHNHHNNTVGVPGILKKETKDYDAIIATKRYQEQIKNTSWFCRTNYFQKMCHQAFDAMDSDGSGQMDETELYAGLLLIHLQLGMYAGPAACRPLSREQVHTVFVKMDTDHSGTLNVLEFQSIMSVLFGNVLLRVIVQWSMTLMIVPWLAQFILSGMMTLISSITNVITNLDEHSTFFNFVELTIEGIVQFIYMTILPNFIKVIISMIQRCIGMVPISIWKALPLTILSTVLGIVVVPYCIFQVDHYFQTLAERHHQRQMARNLTGTNGSGMVVDGTTTNAMIHKSKSL